MYILTNKNRTVLYTGVTSDLAHRLKQHIQEPQGFVQRYSVQYLVYFESINGMLKAIQREKEIKGWTRAKKEALINRSNPEWEFLNDRILGEDD